MKLPKKIVAVLIILVIALGAYLVIGGDKNDDSQVVDIANDKKYVIMVSFDTLREDHTSMAGYERDLTPNLEALAKDGAYYSDAYTPIPLTSPAHLSLFTGLYPKTLGVFSNGADLYNNDINTTLPQLFKAKGYKTAAFIGASRLNRKVFQKGFDIFDYKIDLENSQQALRPANITTRKAQVWLQENYTQPFFLFVHYYDIHSPYDTICEKSFSVGKSPSTEIFQNGNLGTFVTQYTTVPTAQDYDYLIARYDEEIACTDHHFGTLIDELKGLGIYDESTIIAFGDHGENFDHNSIFHGRNLYQPGLRIPLVVKSPNLSTINKDNRVILFDLFPTLLRRFDLGKSQNDGIDLEDSALTNRKSLLLETHYSDHDEEGGTFHMSSILQDSTKLIVDRNGETFVDHEAYNILKDPGELNNIWDTNSSLLKTMQENLKAFVKNE